MLARLLRRLILFQLALAVLIAMALIHFTRLAPPIAWPLALSWLLVLPMLSMLRSFRRARRNQGSQAGASPLSHWLRAAGVEIVLTWRLFLWRQAVASPSAPDGRGEAPPAHPDPARTPVLLLHGFVCNHRIWDEMAAHLRAQGHPVRRIDLEPLFCSIDEYAPRVEAAVATLLADQGHGRLAVVGHSMGGLAIRAWLRAYPHRLDSVVVAVTLGTPHRGTLIDPSPRLANTREMAYGSQWLAALAESESTALRERFSVSIARQDQIVFPQTEQSLPGIPVRVWDAIGHLELCSHPAVLAAVSEQIHDRARMAAAGSRNAAASA
ncbi:MAG: alpha/beta fold hydrolase [Burkholderiaceae bacterium]|nr:alpha/beta fold hydrolase [Burkholderiaceae bacterium]MBP7660601.1 alpha/beta fold hydrolase [Burkholderiaceae bacterium]